MSLTTTDVWRALLSHAERLRATHLRTLFAADPGRAQAFAIDNEDLFADFSKQRIDAPALDALLDLAVTAGVERRRDAMFAGEMINLSEQRAALHVALRADRSPFPCAEFDVMPEVADTRRRMAEIANAVRSGHWLGQSGLPIRAVVNIGIGGSDLGPKMATRALLALAHPTLSVDFVSNLDGAQLAPLLQTLDPRTTLFIVASKTFTTLETQTNATTARDWLIANLGDAAAARRHFIAVTANPQRALAFGIAPDSVLPMADWVGGRFSLWSAVGLPLMIAAGPAAFDQLLAGALAADAHFCQAPLARNLPVLMALIEVWNCNFLGAPTRAVLPYNESLRHLPAYLQQLEMESNGKAVGATGEALACASAPVVWGDVGINGQHAFFQLLHQGGRLVPCDFIAAAESDFPLAGHHDALLASCFAQSAALAFGRTAAEARAEMAASDPSEIERVAPHRVFPGNQPSTTLLLRHLDPRALGRLIATYEHKVFVESVLWGLNAFDQWGVELGKQLAQRILPALRDPASAAGLDASTLGLLARCRPPAG